MPLSGITAIFATFFKIMIFLTQFRVNNTYQTSLMFWVFTLSHWVIPTWCCGIYNLKMFFSLCRKTEEGTEFCASVELWLGKNTIAS